MRRVLDEMKRAESVQSGRAPSPAKLVEIWAWMIPLPV